LAKLYKGNAFSLLSSAPGGWTFTHLITDPPYAEATHEGARTGDANTKLVRFAPFSEAQLGDLLFLTAQRVLRWGVFTCDFRHMAYLQSNPVPGWRFIRMGIWVKNGAAPQFTGDRPAQGWEAIAMLHRVEAKGCPKAVRMAWNGGGRAAVFTHTVERGPHPTQKPVSLYGEFIRLFTEPNESVLDPLCGSGTTLVAAKAHGRRAAGIESEEGYLRAAKARLAQEGLNLGGL
jgi:site-specific DNA-methyltransferase (adenine-specific)